MGANWEPINVNWEPNAASVALMAMIGLFGRERLLKVFFSNSNAS
jgi:hypothetical protein